MRLKKLRRKTGDIRTITKYAYIPKRVYSRKDDEYYLIWFEKYKQHQIYDPECFWEWENTSAYKIE